LVYNQTSTQINSAFHPSGVGKSNIGLACLAGVETGCIHLRRVAGSVISCGRWRSVTPRRVSVKSIILLMQWHAGQYASTEMDLSLIKTLVVTHKEGPTNQRMADSSAAVSALHKASSQRIVTLILNVHIMHAARHPVAWRGEIEGMCTPYSKIW